MSWCGYTRVWKSRGSSYLFASTGHRKRSATRSVAWQLPSPCASRHQHLSTWNVVRAHGSVYHVEVDANASSGATSRSSGSTARHPSVCHTQAVGAYPKALPHRREQYLLVEKHRNVPEVNVAVLNRRLQLDLFGPQSIVGRCNLLSHDMSSVSRTCWSARANFLSMILVARFPDSFLARKFFSRSC